MLDSVTGERLGAAVDRRVGANAITHIGSTWSDVEAAFEFWIDRMARRLRQLGMEPTVRQSEG